MGRPRNTFSVNFICKPAKAGKDGKAPIYCYCNVNGQRAVITLPLKCFPSEFKESYSSNKMNPIKTLCNTTQLKLEQIYTGLGARASAEGVKTIYLNGSNTYYSIQNMFDDFKTQKTLENIGIETWGKYVGAINLFLEYTNHKYTDDASTVTFADVLKFEAKSMENSASTTTKKRLKNIKAFFTLAVAGGKITANPFGTMKIGHGVPEEDTEFLNYSEIKEIRDLKLDSDCLKNVRWCFLFQCFSGLNYGDLSILKEGDVKKDKHNQYYISKERYKRGKFDKGQKYTSVLYEDAIEVYKLFGEKLPLISDQKYNDYLEKLISMTSITKHITSKCGRKTYGNYLYKVKGLKLEVIQKMMGHTNLRQTQEYVKVFDEDVLKETNKIEKLSTKRKLSTLDILMGTIQR